MKRNGFSMIELVFIVVILGSLAAVAVPIFVSTRTDSRVAMLRSDIASAMKAIPARIFEENIDPTQAAPNGYNSWNEWIIEIGGLDKNRWKVVNTPSARGIMPIATEKSGLLVYCGASQISDSVIGINTSGELIFNPNNLAKTAHSENICKILKESYPSGSNRTIPLSTSKGVTF